MTEVSISNELLAIRTRFLEMLDGRKADIRQNLIVANGDPSQAEEAFAEIEKTLHKIAGSAGTIGLQALGEKARQVEERLFDMRQSGKIQAQIASHEIGAFLDSAANVRSDTI